MIVERISPCLPISEAIWAAGHLEGCSLLESGFHNYGLGRYSLLAISPVKEIRGAGSDLQVIEKGKCRTITGDPRRVLKDELEKRRTSASCALPFHGGAIGYFAYDWARYPSPSIKKMSIGQRNWDFRFAFYDSAIIWDHKEQDQFLVSEKDDTKSFSELRSIIKRNGEAKRSKGFRIREPISRFDRRSFMEKVGKVKEYIRDGEVYQVNLSERFQAGFTGCPTAVYDRLRNLNPAPYSAYLNFGDEQILSSSPERFLKKSGTHVSTRPIKGTRKRGKTIEEDGLLKLELENSGKDKAELLMIVDLERNDLGRVCNPGSVVVSSLNDIEAYASVFHQTASIEGELSENFDVFDCVDAMFPGGSITGAPKIRAMEIIDELEANQRGIYTGSIGYIGFDGRADFNIAIRTIRIADQTITFNVGSGIVWDSDPSAEFEELNHKARSLFEALGVNEDGG